MTWTVEFYEEEDGSAPVEEFMAKLPKKHRKKAVAIVKRLEEVGPTLPFPYSSQAKGKIRELRTQQGKDRIRILYFADGRRRFILLHAFIKRTGKLSVNDIEIAERRMKKHERKMGNLAGKRLKASPKGVSNVKIEEPIEGLRGDVSDVNVDEEGNVTLQWNGEWGEGRMWGKVGESLNFEGRALCGPLQVLMSMKLHLKKFVAGEYEPPVEVQHQCEKQDECLARELLDELGVDQAVSWVQ